MPTHPTLLRALVTARHWQKYETFARQFERAAQDLAARVGESSIAQMSVSQRQFERWYAGRVRTVPHPDSCRILEHMFSDYTVNELLTPPVDVALNRTVKHELAMRDGTESSALTVGPGVVHAASKETGDPFEQGWPQSDRGYSYDPGRIIAMATRRALRFGAAADSSNIGEESLEQLRHESGRLAVAYLQHPVGQVLDDIVALQDHVFGLLEGRQRPNETKDLYVVGGLASGMMAKAAHDLHNPQMAMTHARTAMLCARNADHPALAAWVTGLQSLITYWADRPREALEYAQAGQEIAGVTGTVRVWLASLEGRAWSALGNTAQSREAIHHAVDLRNQVGTDDLDDLGGMCYFSAARQFYYAADAGASLPVAQTDTKANADTERYAERAIASYERSAPNERSFGDEAGSRTDLAIVRIRANDFDGAAEAIRPVLEMPTGLRIHGVVGSVLNVHREISTKGSDALIGREIQDEIEGYCRTPVAALPR